MGYRETIMMNQVIDRTSFSAVSFSRSSKVETPVWLTWCLIMLALMSALAIIYMQDLYRRNMINYQNTVLKTEQLITDKNRLLVESGTCGAEAEIYRIAAKNLQMQLPTAENSIIISV